MALTHYIGGKLTGLTADFPPSLNYPELTTFIDVELFKEFILVNGVWEQVGKDPDNIVAFGGVITQDGDFKVHTFTANGTFDILSGEGSVDRLIVGGAGGGGSIGGGGGAGDFVTDTKTMTLTSLSVVVGTGGIGGTPSVPASATPEVAFPSPPPP